MWNILNVQDVIKEVPNDPEVHWRAVPSLREIWMEERLRMVSSIYEVKELQESSMIDQ